jgi:hypothetical protein
MTLHRSQLDPIVPGRFYDSGITSRELLPCLCGGRGAEDASGASEISGHDYQSYEINCTTCRVGVEVEGRCSCCYDTQAIAITAWNRLNRPETSQQ